MTIAEPQKQCFELFRMQNFPGLCTWAILGWAYSPPPSPDSPATEQFFSLLGHWWCFPFKSNLNIKTLACILIKN